MTGSMQNELVVQQNSSIQTNPMSLLMRAVDAGAQIDVIERLAKLQTEMMEREAKIQFDKSMQAAQSEMRRIGADAVNPQTRSKYATYAKLDGALRPIYSRHGFAVSFNTGEAPTSDIVRVIAYVSHQDGHTREYRIDMPADGKGAKGGDVMTRTHATGAGVSYGQRYLLKMIWNVAVGETDDDGNGASGRKMDERSLADHLAAVESANSMEQLKIAYDNATAAAKLLNDQDALRAIIRCKDRVKAQLGGAA